MIAVETNILVYAHRADSPWHERAAETLATLAEGASPWAIPWHCLHEFIGIVTHPRIYKPPSSLRTALETVSEWCKSPSLVLLAEGPGYLDALDELARAAKVAGAQFHDTRVAAVCVQHGVTELLTADRDFSRYPALRVRNPLIG